MSHIIICILYNYYTTFISKCKLSPNTPVYPFTHHSDKKVTSIYHHTSPAIRKKPCLNSFRMKTNSISIMVRASGFFLRIISDKDPFTLNSDIISINEIKSSTCVYIQ